MRISVKPHLAVPATLIIPLTQYSGELATTAVQELSALTGQPPQVFRQGFRARANEVLPLFYDDGESLLLLGLGGNPGFAEVLGAFRHLAHQYRHLLTGPLALSWEHGNEPADYASWSEAAVNGLGLGAYQQGRLKTDTPPGHPLQSSDSVLTVIVPEQHTAEVEQAVRRGQVIAESQCRIMDLVNAPSNHKTPQDLATWAKASARENGFRAEVWERDRIEREGLHALLAVNRGSEHPAVFIVMEYQGPGAQAESPVALVGKGVTFDTGGLSIKPSTNMHYMKSDMGGAAAVLGAIETAARLKLPVHLYGIVPSTDNSVDAKAVKPSEVISSYSGKSIEVIDTDAEGRLILADGLAYTIRNHHPEVVIDLATLTGSTVRTFGYHLGALFSNNDELAEALFSAGETSGERLWRLPLHAVYADEMKSDIADIKNFSGRPMSGAITAAKFLEFFVGDHPQWAHLDIAGVAFGDSPFASGKVATGFGIRLLLTYLMNRRLDK
ncbi:MAG: leucyl aminopeptidase family protein [Lewinella sp.]|nr:leucyl aminopeptidase family protein [Lewinella sp.]